MPTWAGRAENDEGLCPGTTTADADRIAELEREVRELRDGARPPLEVMCASLDYRACSVECGENSRLPLDQVGTSPAGPQLVKLRSNSG